MNKKPIYKRVWFWIIVIIIAAVATSGGNDSTNTVSNDSSDQNTETKQESEPKEVTYKIGDTIKVGNVSYKVKKMSTASSVGPSILPSNAKDTFVVIDISVKNNDSKAITVDSNFFKLISNGKEFEADSMASMSANQGEDGEIKNSFFYDSLNPDVSLSGKVVFDVSSDLANSNDLQLQLQTGIWGTEKGLVNLK